MKVVGKALVHWQERCGRVVHWDLREDSVKLVGVVRDWRGDGVLHEAERRLVLSWSGLGRLGRGVVHGDGLDAQGGAGDAQLTRGPIDGVLRGVGHVVEVCAVEDGVDLSGVDGGEDVAEAAMDEEAEVAVDVAEGVGQGLGVDEVEANDEVETDGSGSGEEGAETRAV